MANDRTPLTSEIRSPKGRAVQMLRVLMERGEVVEGDRLPSEAKLARAFEVSRITLRAALSVLEREGLVRREPYVGCIRVKPHARQGSLMSRVIVLVTDARVARHGAVYGGMSDSFVSGVIDCVERHEINLMRISTFDEDIDTWLTELIKGRPMGVVLSCWNRSGAWPLKVLEALKAAGVPVVSFGHSAPLDNIDTVESDHVSGTEKLVRFLAEQGKRRILRLWTAPAEASWIRSHDLGYEKVVRELGLPSVPAIYVDGRVERIDADESNFRMRYRQFAGHLAEHIHCPEPVDAILVGTDSEALAVLAACRLYGRTDIAVVGYDNYWQSIPERKWESAVPIATIDKNNHLLGEQSVELLLERIGGKLPEGGQTRFVAQQVVLTSGIGLSC